MENLHKVIRTYGPILHVRHSEEYVPTGIDWYVNRCRLSNEATGLFTTNVTLADLPTGTESAQCHLKLENKSDRVGDLTQAKAYVKVQEVGRYVEVQFWFFYGYSSPIRAKLSNVTAWKRPIEIDLLPGIEARWHSVSICFADAELTVPLYVRSRSEMMKFSDCHRDGDQVHVYSSAALGLSLGLEEKSVTMHRNIIGDQIRCELKTETSGPVGKDISLARNVDCSERYEIIDATLLGNAGPAEPSWTKFDGQVGSGYRSLLSLNNEPSSKQVRKTVQRYVNPWPEIFPRIIKAKAKNVGSRPPFGHRIMMTNISDLLVSIVEELEDPYAPIAVKKAGMAA